jgi:flagellar FliL protein
MSDTAAAPANEAPAAEESKSPGLGLVIGGLAGGLAIGAAAGVFLLGPMVARASGYAPGAAQSAKHDEKKEEGKAGEEGGAKSTIHNVDNLVLNPAGSGGTRFLMCSVAIELADEKFAEVLNSRDAEVRDAVLRVLGQKTVDELTDVAQREAFKAEVQGALDGLFKQKGAIRRLYFPQFVIQ